MPRDIRSSKDWIDNPSIREDTTWTRDVPDDDVTPQTRAVPTAIPMSTDGGVSLVNPDGTPMAMRSVVSRTKDEIQILWDRKQMREPCFMCKWFKCRVFNPEEKNLLFLLLSKEHGWKQEWVEGEFNDPHDFEFCVLHETLTHKNASCPRGFRKRDDV